MMFSEFSLKRLFAPLHHGPSYPTLPVVDAAGQTTVPGVYAIGELAGTPLVRLGLNAGHDLVQAIAPALRAEPSDDTLDLVIIGAGSSGIAATVAALDAGLKTVTLEATRFANTFVNMTKGKVLFAEPADVPLRSRVWFEECTREDLLERWTALWRDEGLDIREHQKVRGIQGSIGAFVVETDSERFRCKRVALCLGKAGNPRTLQVAGETEHVDRIHHRLLDADEVDGEDVLIVGAGDVGVEAAIALAASGRNRVTLSTIDPALTFPKKRNREAILALEQQGRVRIALDSRIEAFEDGHARLSTAEGSERLPFDRVYEMIGAELPTRFLRAVGVRLNTDWPGSRWAFLAGMFVAVYTIYALKSYGKGITAWPFQSWIPEATYDRWLLLLFEWCFVPFGWMFSDVAMGEILADRGFQQGYLYSGLYTVVMVVFGYEALIRWRSQAADPRYQTWRYITLLAFQVGFFVLVNGVGVHAMSVKYSWRLWGLYQPFPLFFNTFFWWYEGDPSWIFWFFVGAGLLGTFGLIPWLARNHGKRFCTWVCGCGGLAETLGDRWRHLSAKGPRSRAWEFQGSVIAVAAALVALVLVGMYESTGNNPWWNAYNYIVDFWLVAVIPISLYPFFGGKVWCRYWCPLAAYNGWLAGWYGRLKIVSNDKCITCTECSKYCQVGVDVMAFARNEHPFDNSNSACIQCGVCIDVCPMGVLSFETSDGLAKDLIRDYPSALGRAE